VSPDADSRFRELLAHAEDDDGVVGLFVFGSRAREGFADDASDYDVGVVLREEALKAFDERWPYEHGAPVEVASTTLAGLRDHAEPGTPSEWARYQYAHVELLVDKSGEVSAILAEKARLPEEHRRTIAADALDAYLNSTYRSLREHDRGLHLAARLDAAESVPPLLTAIFAFEQRVRPFNKYLEWELREHPLREPAWAVEPFLPRVERISAGDAGEQRAMFRDVERVAREHGFGEVIDGWEPDVTWLRGEAEYRSP
jgi:predicted nucleotidyltransferase